MEGKNAPKTFLITGGNRGLGLEMAKQIIEKFQPELLIATYRDQEKSQELFKLAEEQACVKPLQLDVTQTASFASFCEKVKGLLLAGQGLQVLINNAGYFNKEEGQGLAEIKKDLVLRYMEVNTFPGLFLTQALLPLLELAKPAAAFVINFTSKLASINDNGMGGYYASRASRCAGNAITKSFALDLKPKSIYVIAMNPGWVQTDQGGPEAPLTPPQSVAGILGVLEDLRPENAGSFYQWNGQILPW